MRSEVYFRVHAQWKRMCKRATNPQHPHFHIMKDYEVDKRWLESFEAFTEDMGFSENKFICREDLTKGFNKDNCYWGDYHFNPITKFYIHEGQTFTKSEICSIYKISMTCLNSYLKKNNDDLEKSLDEILNTLKHKKFLYKGRMENLAYIAKSEDIPYARLSLKIRSCPDLSLDECIEQSRPNDYFKSDYLVTYKGKRITLKELFEKENIKMKFETKKIFAKYKGDVNDLLSSRSDSKFGRVIQIRYKGQFKTIKEIADLEGIDFGRLRNRYYVDGDIDIAIKTTREIDRKSVVYKGKLMRLSEVIKQENFSKHYVYKLCSQLRAKGMSPLQIGHELFIRLSDLKEHTDDTQAA